MSGNGATSVFITFSKDEDLFYDVSASDLAAWADHARAFVIFVLGSADQVLILPLTVLRDRVVSRMKAGERGNFKLHVTGSSRLCFREARHFALDDYRNAFELLDEGEINPPAV
ncbi:MAG: hypothetical protein Q7S20_00445 [Gemmatimonadaceae bacterium]|nr:hypothetical protein [Gemmatimonadaceae bacterium]